jgi:hypothetical protein
MIIRLHDIEDLVTKDMLVPAMEACLMIDQVWVQRLWEAHEKIGRAHQLMHLQAAMGMEVLEEVHDEVCRYEEMTEGYLDRARTSVWN